MTVPAVIDQRFRAAAAAQGLLDVAYEVTDSPVGPLLVAVTDIGVCRVSFDADPEHHLDELARAFGVRVLRSAPPTDVARRALDEYFQGRREDFGLSVDLRPLRPFQRLVLTELARVSYGRTATYGELASRIGKPGASRSVGSALNRNPIPILLPCHRIVGSRGNLVGYAGGLERKRTLLELEGVVL